MLSPVGLWGLRSGVLDYDVEDATHGATPSRRFVWWGWLRKSGSEHLPGEGNLTASRSPMQRWIRDASTGMIVLAFLRGPKNPVEEPAAKTLAGLDAGGSSWRLRSPAWSRSRAIDRPSLLA